MLFLLMYVVNFFLRSCLIKKGYNIGIVMELSGFSNLDFIYFKVILKVFI